MNTLLLLLSLALSLSAFAEEPKPDDEFVSNSYSNPETTELAEEKKETIELTRRSYDPKKGHWLTTFGIEAGEYKLPFHYQGAHQSIGKKHGVDKDEARKLYGGRLGFGREFHIAGGLTTATKVEGFYEGTLFEKSKTADPQIADSKSSSVKRTGQIYGADVTQTLSYIFEYQSNNPLMELRSVLFFEPFVEVGIGKARAFNKTYYFRDLGNYEHYDQRIIDELSSIKFGGGFNIIATNGFFFFLKAIQTTYNVDKRTTAGHYAIDGGPETPVAKTISTSLPSVMLYSFGGGYKF